MRPASLENRSEQAGYVNFLCSDQGRGGFSNQIERIARPELVEEVERGHSPVSWLERKPCNLPG
jgi:hypothetical protein